jgi:hypothetical protein
VHNKVPELGIIANQIEMGSHNEDQAEFHPLHFAERYWKYLIKGSESLSLSVCQRCDSDRKSFEFSPRKRRH